MSLVPRRSGDDWAGIVIIICESRAIFSLDPCSRQGITYCDVNVISQAMGVRSPQFWCNRVLNTWKVDRARVFSIGGIDALSGLGVAGTDSEFELDAEDKGDLC
jgi:hypothetical protein